MPREQALARVRRAHPAGPLVAVQRQGVGGQLLAPERLLEALPQRLRLPRQLGRLGPPARAAAASAAPARRAA